ncbi:MAG: TonB-dependent receptor plug domain-containing protein, partial [Xanthomonadales bacterium]|nr:TonB-dependent receptor plug domain-containing protein [Xanthomonadales bacterium]
MISYRTIAAVALTAAALILAPVVFAQDQADDAQGADARPDDPDYAPLLEEVIVTGSIRQSVATSINTKRFSDNLVEAIYSEDIGKLPDQNLAEVMENITGVQITRTAGVGTGVQIRGTNANRVEINGVSTVGSGAGRS